MFRVGDRVRALPNDVYCITKDGWEGFVTEIHRNKIIVKEAPGFRSCHDEVSPDYFEVIVPAPRIFKGRWTL